MIVKERMARGTQQVDARGRSAAFLDIAEGLGLGVAARHGAFVPFGRLTISADKRNPRPTLKEGDADMKCPKCRSENPLESTYCGKCATRIRGFQPFSTIQRT
jgi:hypothetical protein